MWIKTLITETNHFTCWLRPLQSHWPPSLPLCIITFHTLCLHANINGCVQMRQLTCLKFLCAAEAAFWVDVHIKNIPPLVFSSKLFGTRSRTLCFQPGDEWVTAQNIFVYILQFQGDEAWLL